jgi:hypothetical protein
MMKKLITITTQTNLSTSAKYWFVNKGTQIYFIKKISLIEEVSGEP